ncbi:MULTISPECIES: NADPH:quinone reductase [Streptomyces]|uniref:NADPH:quinone reductase n=1 Tax=Streptomyces albus subsp. chlorinus TaxID=337066 RepID=A0A3G4YJS8_9ACTN|nr:MULTISPECIES: NADPH:quinone reductase [Streptomyces]UZN59893.1 NADPH:quinone reductase [Streptomyces albus subsp. chlorinus] [Streptomyces sp. GBA 94-10 4N24]WAE20006.1 NADPH:quinone reductase [Streptomyces albus subsp. chlorinus] [Streptomyces albidoflavus]AYV61404.1 NADPH:quinone reductase [Streptomyces albus subsp. chlorinus]NSC25053.1 NADPH:quinone reductase [Streptomyces albus subsp. chlorinus]UZN60197.1 NADPH:quinone reductase [Streptomyces albus subsp. chlorinus] [Streptomyces sp. GB
MRAAYINEFGPAHSIRFGPLPDPRPGTHEVLVDVEATTANHVDTFIRSGAVETPVDFPFVVGRDLVGRVAGTGDGVTGFRVGERVWCNSLGHAGRQGAAAERAVVPAERLYRLPDGVAPQTAVTVVHPAATAYLGLVTHGRLRAGQTVVVVGAAGNVGAAMLVVAAAAGARVVAVARARDAAYCRDLGADVVVDREADGLGDRLARACPEGVDVWADAAGVNDLTTAVRLLARRGRVVLLAGLHTTPVLPAGPLYVRDGSVVGFAITGATAGELAQAAGCVNRLLAGGRLRPREVRVLPLSATAEVHRMLEAGELHGRRVALTTG